MPFRFVCSQCGAILIEKENLEYGGNFVRAVINEVGGQCPKCGHKLQVPPVNVEVKPNPATVNKPIVASAFKHDYHQKSHSNRVVAEPYLTVKHRRVSSAKD